MLQVCALGSIEKTDREVHVSLFYARTLQELTLPTTGDLCRRTALIWEIRTQLGGNKYNAHPCSTVYWMHTSKYGCCNYATKTRCKKLVKIKIWVKVRDWNHLIFLVERNLNDSQG